MNAHVMQVCCGDCDHHPCQCMTADDGDAPWLYAIEGGDPAPLEVAV